jgi:dTDP-glucose 4,6-dehydratase
VRVIVTGGCGFIGSHLCDALIARGDHVVCLDNLSTGRIENVVQLLEHPCFEFTQCDVSGGIPVQGPVDAVAHLACPASPVDYLRLPLETLAVGSSGTDHALRLAAASGARFLLASTSEVYGDPVMHPQPEEYWGNVNPIGPRSVYDEAKRFGEALAVAYARARGVNVGIVRIFNTYGPRMSPGDGRVVTNFIVEALRGQPITIYGDGSQTRSFCYVDDLIRGLVAMLDSAERGPINLGNPEEFTIRDFAELVLRLTGSPSRLEYLTLPQDDPARRRPVVTRAWERIGWRPEIPVAEGVSETIRWLRGELGESLPAAAVPSQAAGVTARRRPDVVPLAPAPGS